MGQHPESNGNGKVLEGGKNKLVGKGYSLVTATVFIVGEEGGAGILSLAFAASQAGWAGIAMLLFAAACAGIAGICLSESWLILEERYPEYRNVLTRKPLATIGYHSFGTPMSMALSFMMNTLRIGASTVFLILASDLLSELLGPYIHWSSCRYIPFVAAFLVVPMWLGSPKYFWPMAYLAMISTGIGTVMLIAFLITKASRDGFAPDYTVEGGAFSYLTGFGTFLFAFGGGSAFPNFQNDMADKSKFTMALIFGFIGLLMLYVPTAGLGYAVFGSGVKENIILNVDYGGFVTAILICFLIHCLNAVIIVINPVFLDLEEAFKIPKRLNWKRCAFRTSLLIIVLMIAETFPDFGQILNLIGATNVAISSIILPPIMYAKLCYDHRLNSAWKKRPISSMTLFAFAIVTLTGLIGGLSSAYITLTHWQPLSSACYINSPGPNTLSNSTTLAEAFNTVFPTTTLSTIST